MRERAYFDNLEVFDSVTTALTGHLLLKQPFYRLSSALSKEHGLLAVSIELEWLLYLSFDDQQVNHRYPQVLNSPVLFQFEAFVDEGHLLLLNQSR